MSDSGSKSKMLFRGLLNIPWLVVLGIALLTLPFIYFLSDLRVDNSLDIWYSNSDSTYINYQNFKKQFGSDESIIVIYRNDSLFTQEQISLNKSLSKELEEISGVHSVTSLTSLRMPKIRGFRILNVPVIPTRAASYKRTKEKITGQAILVNNIISADGAATGIIVSLDKNGNNSEGTILQNIKTIILSDRYNSNLYYLVGNIPIIEENNRISGTESTKFMLLCLVLIFLLLLLHFRHPLLAFAPIFVALINVIWTLGTFALFGQSLNMVASIIPIIILVISIAVSVHIITRYQKFYINSSTRKEALKNALGSVAKPCLYTSITTIAAFLAFLASDMAPIASFGLFTAIGIGFSIFLAFTLLPSILYYIKIKSNRSGRASIKLWENISTGLTRFTVRNKRKIIWLSLMILLLSIFGLMQLSFESDQIKYFKASNPVRQSNNIAGEWFEGIYPIEILFDLPEDIYLQPEKYYTYFSELEEGISQFEEVVALHSPLVFFNSLFPNDTTRVVGQVGTALAGRYSNKIRNNPFLTNYLSADGLHYRISIRTKWMSNKQTIHVIRKLRESIDVKVNNASPKYYISGLASMYINLNERLIQNKIKSFIISFSLIFLLLIILLRSLFLALIGMIPNVAPIITTIGLMGWLNIPLDIATMLIAAISLGIAVDDTIHFLTVFRQTKTQTPHIVERIRLSYNTIGRAITLTSVLVICGFSGMIFSTYLPFVYFGIFISLNVLFALLYDLFLLPAIIFITQK